MDNIFERHRNRNKGPKIKIIENGSNKKNTDSNIKEKTIFRKQRLNKEGVVDLDQKEIKKIIKASTAKRGKTCMKLNSKQKIFISKALNLKKSQLKKFLLFFEK